MSAVAFFRLQCDGGCGRWLSDVTARGLAKVTTVRSRALVFPDAGEAMDQSVEVGWTKGQGEMTQGVSLCGTCRARRKKETEHG